MYIGTFFVHLIISPLIASADSCSFFFLSSFYLSAIFPFTCNFIWFVKLRASAGISGYVWGVQGCVGCAWGCAWVCAGECWCVWVWAGVWVCASACKCTEVCIGVCGCGKECMGVHRHALVCTGVCGYAQVCVCVWDEFSEFLLENRVSTSADFNTYPIRIFYSLLQKIWFRPKCGSFLKH